MLVTEDSLTAAGLQDDPEQTGQGVPADPAGQPGPYAVLGNASTAKDPYALTVDGVLPHPHARRSREPGSP